MVPRGCPWRHKKLLRTALGRAMAGTGAVGGKETTANTVARPRPREGDDALVPMPLYRRLPFAQGPLAYGKANPAAPAARDSGHYHGTGEMVPFVDRPLEWGGVTATSLSVLGIVPRRCARLTHFLHPTFEGHRCGADYPTADDPSPAAPAVRRTHSPHPQPRPHLRLGHQQLPDRHGLFGIDEHVVLGAAQIGDVALHLRQIGRGGTLQHPQLLHECRGPVARALPHGECGCGGGPEGDGGGAGPEKLRRHSWGTGFGFSARNFRTIPRDWPAVHTPLPAHWRRAKRTQSRGQRRSSADGLFFSGGGGGVSRVHFFCRSRNKKKRKSHAFFWRRSRTHRIFKFFFSHSTYATKKGARDPDKKKSDLRPTPQSSSGTQAALPTNPPHAEKPQETRLGRVHEHFYDLSPALYPLYALHPPLSFSHPSTTCTTTDARKPLRKRPWS